MELANQVCSLQLSKRLKELGVSQDALFYHSSVMPAGEIIPASAIQRELAAERYVAFTVSELGEMLPKQVFNIYTAKVAHNARDGAVVADRTFWCWRYKERERAKSVHDKDEFFAETEADARAKMLIFLLEQRLITL